MNTAAYRKGVEAFKKGEPQDANPFSSKRLSSNSAKRKQWFDGYFDTRIGERLGPVFKKYGLVWEPTS